MKQFLIKTSHKLLLSFFLVALFKVRVVMAAGPVTGGLVPCGTSSTPDCTLCHLWQLLDNAINFLTFNLAIPVASVLFVVSGIMLLVSTGSEKRVTTAKSVFFNTAIGLLIIFASWLIIDTILQTIAVGSFQGAWNEFPTCS